VDSIRSILSSKVLEIETFDYDKAQFLYVLTKLRASSRGNT